MSRFLELFIERIEVVASHFRYTEEYVLQHSPHWLKRKFKQAQKEKKEANQRRIIEGAQSLFIVLDSVFNQGKGIESILSPAEEERKEAVASAEYVAKTWWKSEQK